MSKVLIPGVNFRGEFLTEGFDNFIKPVYINAPHTEITNRAQVLDESNTLKSLMPVERVMVNSISQISDEFGPNGEAVWEIDSKDVRVRFVGDWNNFSTPDGSSVATSSFDSFVEITFYGTALNLLSFYNDISNLVYGIEVDGVAQADFSRTGFGDTPDNRNYGWNAVFNMTSGLTLGWHTVKLFKKAPMPGGQAFAFFGCEILNEAAQSDVLTGTAYSGLSSKSLDAASTLPYKPAALTGTTGARVVNYFDVADGALKQAFTEVPASPSYLGSADHTNEKLIRKINFREFGANRGDDFSTLSTTSDRAFTLDDGTTTLTGNNVQAVSTGYLSPAGNVGNFITLTFVGTGLDILLRAENISSDNWSVEVDGVSAGVISDEPLTEEVRKICSDLPYGTHTVKFEVTAVGSDRLTLNDFYIYEPKKPSLPSTAVEIKDYNLMADFVGQSVSGFSSRSTGTLSKAALREFAYIGSNWSIGTGLGGNYRSFNSATNTTSEYAEYTFFGTGFVFSGLSAPGGANIQFTVDGSITDFSSYDTGYFSSQSGGGFTASTGILDQSTASNSQESGCYVNGLPLGLHTLRITNLGGVLRMTDLSIVTPTHKNDKSFKIGNLSSKDVRALSPIQKAAEVKPSIGEAKALLYFDMINNQIRYSDNISAVIDAGSGNTLVFLNTPMKSDNYVVLANPEDDPVVANRTIQVRDKSSYSFRIITSNPGVGTTDTNYNIAIFGELADE